MRRWMHQTIHQYFLQPLSRLGGAITFYTVIPLPSHWRVEFDGIARFAPLVGIAIGGLLGLADIGLQWLGVPPLTRSTGVVALWVGLTGGLHLDGVMDTADGLAVNNPTRRLAVMTDSATGAFGAIAGIILLLLKTTALTDLDAYRWLALMLAAGWGRWGQLFAIICYPYLKPDGKGAFHKPATQSSWHLLPPLLLLLGFPSFYWVANPTRGISGVALLLAGGAIAISVASWFNHRLGGHTGDTYGATVEWTEALLLCFMTAFTL